MHAHDTRLQALETAVYKALADSPENGVEFAAAVRELLDNEDSWAAWKQVGGVHACARVCTLGLGELRALFRGGAHRAACVHARALKRFFS